jgi:hypothetical protein
MEPAISPERHLAAALAVREMFSDFHPPETAGYIPTCITSPAGGPEGAYNEMMALNGIVSDAKINMPHLDAWGDPSTFPHYAIGWAWGGYSFTVDQADRLPLWRNRQMGWIHWPERIKAKGGVPFPVHLRHRHCADGHGGGGPAVSQEREWNSATTVRWNFDDL